ncbi:MAG: GntR family transcriptional regulator [Pirellulales bacterium]
MPLSSDTNNVLSPSHRLHGSNVERPAVDPPSDTGSGDERSCVDEVYQQILLRIIRGEFSGGMELKSTQLARQLGVSRTPIVAGLDRLVTDGILRKEKNKRAVVRHGAENWLVEIHELRLLLEPTAAGWAARHITDSAIDRLQTLASEAAPEGRRDWHEAARDFDYALHLAVADFADNLPLKETIRKCWSFKALSYAIGRDAPQTLEAGYRQHRIILNALARHDQPGARDAMEVHLRSAAECRPEQRIV